MSHVCHIYFLFRASREFVLVHIYFGPCIEVSEFYFCEIFLLFRCQGGDYLSKYLCAGVAEFRVEGEDGANNSDFIILVTI